MCHAQICVMCWSCQDIHIYIHTYIHIYIYIHSNTLQHTTHMNESCAIQRFVSCLSSCVGHAGHVMKYTYISIHTYIHSQQHTATHYTMNHAPYLGSRHILRGAFHHKHNAEGSGVGGGVWGGGGGLKGVVKKEQFGVSRVNCIDCLDRTNVVQVCCSVLQCVAVCCSMLQYIAVVWIVSAALWNCVFTHTHARKRANTQTVASLSPQHTTTHCNTQPYNATY